MASPPPRTGIVIFSGGSATNSLVDIFESVRASNHASISYVIPISDNGGSSSEIIRVFGGPGIGDVRSRLVRLVPDQSSSSHSPPETSESSAVKRLLNHRLPADSYPAARAEWFDLVEGTHALWDGVSSPKRELVRSFLNCFNQEALKRTRPTSRFDFSGASVGNLFLTGARLFTGSFEAAIYLFGEVCGVPDGAAVLPALNTNFAVHIAAGLEDGSVIVGQNDISHPSIPSAAVPLPGSITRGLNTPAPSSHHGDDDEDDHEDEHEHIEDANLPGSLPALRRPAIRFTKDQEEALPSRISRIWYINPYGQEIRLPANPRVLAALSTAHAAIYSIGSLYTSLIPSLILRGVGDAITSHCQHKILILNGCVDRETSGAGVPFTALDFVAAVADACAQSRGMRPGAVAREEYAQYVTHVVYLEGERVPVVERRVFAQLGIETTRVYGPRDERGGVTYDGKALAQTLESIIGRVRGERGRRNTVVG